MAPPGSYITSTSIMSAHTEMGVVIKSIVIAGLDPTARQRFQKKPCKGAIQSISRCWMPGSSLGMTARVMKGNNK